MRPSVVLDIGHGPGSGSPTGAVYGRYVERELIEDYVGAASAYLIERGVAIAVLRSGRYEDRQANWRVPLADMYVSCHVNAADPLPRTPYALALVHHEDHREQAGELLDGYCGHVKIARKIVGTAGSAEWPRGLVCIQGVPDSVPAIIFEPFLINHEKHSKHRNFPGIEAVGVGLAKGILQALP